jgi:ParB-like chromosome segregation protein Spo0J
MSGSEDMELWVHPSTLVFDPNNRNRHTPSDLEVTRRLLEKFGQIEPLIVRKSNNMVISGNGRLKIILEQLKWDKVWIKYLDCTDTEFQALSIAINQSGRNSELDYDSITGFLVNLRDSDPEMLGLVGFSQDYINENILALNVAAELPEDAGEVAPPPPPPKARSRGMTVGFSDSNRDLLENCFSLVRDKWNDHGLTPSECILKILNEYWKNNGGT